MAPAQSVPLKLHLVLDFDGTLTKKDTLAALGTIRSQFEYPLALAKPSSSWSTIVDSYMADQTRHVSQYKPGREQRTSLDQHAAWLESLRAVEDCSVARLEAAGIFTGVSKQMVEAAARSALRSHKVEFRAGSAALLSEPHPSAKEPDTVNLSTSIISINWSTCFIRALLYHDLLLHGQDSTSARAIVDKLPIFANEIDGLQGAGEEQDPCPSGRLCASTSRGTVRTSGDKLRILKQLNAHEDKAAAEPLVYVGDSMTDLECLVEANVGICIRDEPYQGGQGELAEALDKIGIRVLPINDLTVDALHATGLQGGKEKTLYWARDPEEVMRALNL